LDFSGFGIKSFVRFRPRFSRHTTKRQYPLAIVGRPRWQIR
jgi:hypothetical protein